jgi:hypothetical protein
MEFEPNAMDAVFKTTDADITRGLCPDCERRMNSDLAGDGRINGGAA